MSFGFPAHHESTRKFDLEGAVLAAAVENALRDLGWKFNRDASGTQFNVRIGWSWWSYGEKMKIQINQGGRIWARSKCVMPSQFIDQGKNRENMERFFDLLSRSLGGHKASL